MFNTDDTVSFERDGKTYTGKIVAYDPYGRNGPTYVVECDPVDPTHLCFHVPENHLRPATEPSGA